MSETTNALDKLLRIILLSNEKHSIADDFDIEAEGLVYATRKTKQIAKGIAATKHIRVNRCVASGIHNRFDGRCDGIIWITGSVRVAIEVAAVLQKLLAYPQRSPLRRLT